MTQDKDNEFDDLIRDAADKYNAPGATPDWEKMQHMLDAHLPAGKAPRRRIFFLLIPLFLLLGGTYLYFTNFHNKQLSAVKEKQASGNPVTSERAEPANTGIENKNANNVKKNKNSSLQDEKIARPGIPVRSSGVSGPVTESSATDKGKEYPAISLQNKKTLRTQDKTASGKGKIARLKNKTAGNMSINTTGGGVEENNVSTETGNNSSSPNKNDIEKKYNNPTNDTLAQNKIADTLQGQLPGKTISTEPITRKDNIPAGKKNKTNNKIKNPFEVALVYAPELTTIGFTNIDKPGSNYGILLGYDISKKITIQTGILRSKKNYIANGEDYKSNYAAPPTYKLTSVKGYCNMYEIPLNIKYKISQKKKINIYAIAGLSSYIMTDEYYTFKYSSYNSAYSWSKEYSSQKNYWFSLATIAAGFEKQISKKFTVGATPFLKIPLRGMGSGDLKLLGTGINFSLSYRPSFAR